MRDRMRITTLRYPEVSVGRPETQLVRAKARGKVDPPESGNHIAIRVRHVDLFTDAVM